MEKELLFVGQPANEGFLMALSKRAVRLEVAVERWDDWTREVGRGSRGPAIGGEAQEEEQKKATRETAETRTRE
jgi:hypothetical protein